MFSLRFRIKEYGGLETFFLQFPEVRFSTKDTIHTTFLKVFSRLSCSSLLGLIIGDKTK